jgi:hypothetical protein
MEREICMTTPIPIQEITLRDYFAAAALQGKLAAGATHEKTAVRSAYQYADLMLEERSRDPA